MLDNEVFKVVNQNYQRSSSMDRMILDLDIIKLKMNLDDISARRRNHRVSTMSLLRRKFRSLRKM